MKLKIILLLITIGLSSEVKAQDPIFTQYFLVPESMNPGFTGFLETTNVGMLHRTQWPDLNFRMDTDYGFLNTWIEGMNSGIGGSVLSHREKFTNYQLFQTNLNYAYRVQLNDDWYFRPGIEVGFGTKSFGFQNLLLEDQINIGTGVINPTTIDSSVLRSKENVAYYDFSAGMLFNKEDMWFGASLKHLNKPNISFTPNGNTPLDMFFAANLGYEFLISDYSNSEFFPRDTKILLTSNYMKQGQFNRLDFGSALLFTKIFVGATLSSIPSKMAPSSHLVTSVNLFGGLQYEHFKFGYSYDLNTSQIGRTGGIYELSVTYQFELKVRCFGCPNYNTSAY